MTSSPAATRLILLALFLSSCYPTEERHRLDKDSLVEGREVKAPTKIHLLGGSVILCENGFFFKSDTIRAAGMRYSPSLSLSQDSIWTIPIDSVAALEYFDKSVRGSRPLGSILLGLTVTGEIVIGSVIILKAIFGSCPTVYTLHGAEERLEAECFSYSIGRMFENDDLDRLGKPTIANRRLTLRVKNEALETHYIDRFNLYYVDHPAGTTAFPVDDDEVVATGEPVPPSSAVNSAGTNVLAEVRNQDGIFYSPDSASVSRMFAEKSRDWIECTVPVPPGVSAATVTVRARNSLQNTTLLYDVMMRNQGLNVLEWTEEINGNPWYSWKLGRWYRKFSGVDLLVYEGDAYVSRGDIADTGPIAWKSTATRISIDEDPDSLKIRLSFFPDNWTIDWIGFDFGDRDPEILHRAECIGAVGTSGSAGIDIPGTIRDDDGFYFVTYPGEATELTFALPPEDTSGGMNRTYFIKSRGYYTEWVRPEWVRERPDVPGFDISEGDRIADRLSRLWLSKKKKFEEEFYEERIPSWDPGVPQ